MVLSRGDKVTLVVLGTFSSLLLVLVLFGPELEKAFPSNVIRKELPAAATDVQEYFDSSRTPPRFFVRYLRATMPESEMPEFARKLGLLQRYSPATVKADTSLNFGGDKGIGDWWNPSPALYGAYIKYGLNTKSYSLAKYENGCVYFKATAW